MRNVGGLKRFLASVAMVALLVGFWFGPERDPGFIVPDDGKPSLPAVTEPSLETRVADAFRTTARV